MRMNTSNVWTRFIFGVSQQYISSGATTITFQGRSQTCTQSMQCKLELDCIHAYLIPSNTTTVVRRRLLTIPDRVHAPSSKPAAKPSYSNPTVKPRYSYPTATPIIQPARFPSRNPTYIPVKKSTLKPSIVPTVVNPISKTIFTPSVKPTSKPSSKPTSKPSAPSRKPTSKPSTSSRKPTSKPSAPSKKPSRKPVFDTTGSLIFKASHPIKNLSLSQYQMHNASLAYHKAVGQALKQTMKVPLPPNKIVINRLRHVVNPSSNTRRKLVTSNNATIVNVIVNLKIYFNTSYNATYLYQQVHSAAHTAITTGLFQNLLLLAATEFYLSTEVIGMILNEFHLSSTPISESAGCPSVIDFSGITQSKVISSSNCRNLTFPKTSDNVEICSYDIASPNSTNYMWQVGYFNTLSPGGLGLDSCPYHDICPGRMLQIDVSDIKYLNNTFLSMISTPTTALSGTSTYEIYGSHTAGIRGNDLLYSAQALNQYIPLPELLVYKYLSLVTKNYFSDNGPSGLLLQKLQIYSQCRPTAAPSQLPSFQPTVVPSTAAPSSPTNVPTAKPTIMPTVAPSAPTMMPSIVPTAPTLSPTTTQLGNFESFSASSYSSRPVLMHKFQFLESFFAYISAYCQQYIVDAIQNATANICNGVEISNGAAIFKPVGPPAPYIQINNIVELSEVSAFSFAFWLTLGQIYDGTVPLFSYGYYIAFPSVTTVSPSSPSYPYEPLGCYTDYFAGLTMTVVSGIPSSSLAACCNYAKTNNFIYYAYGPSFCRLVLSYT